jgi:hypothetical protein
VLDRFWQKTNDDRWNFEREKTWKCKRPMRVIPRMTPTPLYTPILLDYQGVMLERVIDIFHFEQTTGKGGYEAEYDPTRTV